MSSLLTGMKLVWDDTSNACVHIDLEANAQAIRINEYIAQVAPSFEIESNALGTLVGIVGIATTGSMIDVNPVITTGIGLDIASTTPTTGSLVSVVDNSADTGARSVVKIVQDHASAVGAVALEIQADNPTVAAVKISGAATIGIDFTALTASDVLFNCTAGTGSTAAPQTNAPTGFLNIKVAGVAQWIPYYSAT
jgi:hypothetical protein